jgi:hypothetical protein
LPLEVAMGRYFFDIRDGRDFPDEKGSEWPDLAAVRIEAVRYSAEVLKEMGTPNNPGAISLKMIHCG